MEIAAGKALAAVVGADELSPAYIIPSVFNPAVVPAVAGAVSSAPRNRAAELAEDNEKISRGRREGSGRNRPCDQLTSAHTVAVEDENGDGETALPIRLGRDTPDPPVPAQRNLRSRRKADTQGGRHEPQRAHGGINGQRRDIGRGRGRG